MARMTIEIKDGKIHLPVKRVTPNPQGVIKLTPEAIDALMAIVNETGMSIRALASEIIVQAINNNLIRYDGAEESE